jgi:putative PEP-CTERM system histidine kinase
MNIGALSYGLGVALYVVLAALMLTLWRGRLLSRYLVIALLVSIVWASALATFAWSGKPGFAVLLVAEIARDAAWYLFILQLLGLSGSGSQSRSGDLRLLRAAPALACVLMLAWIAAVVFTGGAGLSSETVSRSTHLGQVILAVLGLVLVEQLYRNSKLQLRWAVKLLCLGLAGMFAFDLYMYSNAMLLGKLDANLWAARGVVNALVVPLLAVSVARNKQWSLDIFVSRHVAFHSAALLAAGAYLMLMAGAGYYIRLYGGTWGGVAQAVFLFGSLVLLTMVVASGQVRARLRVLLNKHFFRSKYEYRDEWLKFTDILSHSADARESKQNVISGIASLVNAPCGGLWERSGAGRFAPGASWNLDVPPSASLAGDASLVEFLSSTGWVVRLDELRSDPARYSDLEVPTWLDELWKPWLIVPLSRGKRLEGFIVLSRSSTVVRLNWEDNDILKTVGSQAAAHLAMMRVSDALVEAQQFDAFNRLSSYVVHDLKNVAAQLSLVASNSKKHIDNPEFVADAMLTVQNATDKMNRMLGQLRQGRLEETTTKLVNLLPVLQKVVAARSVDEPRPTLRGGEPALIISADAERLAMMMEHLVQNAQEATACDGTVEVVLRAEPGWACVDVRDSGCGMDDDFLARRLFKPFETTKGNAGMGIGVYESREFVHMWAGDMQVQSALGEGTVFTIRFPMDAQLHEAQSRQAAQ